jgi:glycosyltransferase involved in cell wall biosynthesis
MRVIFCQPTLNRTGSENSLLQMLRGLQNAVPGISFCVLAGCDGSMKPDFESLCEVVIVQAPKLRRNWAGFAEFLRSFIRTHRALKHARADDAVVYVNTLMFPQAIIAGFLNRMPVIVHIREVASTYPRGVYRLYMLIATICARRIVAACEYVFQQRQFPRLMIGVRRRAVLYNAATDPQEVFRRVVTPPFKLLSVIPCTTKKGLFDLVECIRYLKTLLPRSTSFQLDIVGRIEEPRTYKDAVGSLTRNGAMSQVRFHGETGEMDNFFKEAHVLIHPSHSECFPRVLVEACSFSLPCVATRVGGTPEMIEDGFNGYLVPVGATKEMAERVVAILIDPKRHRTFSENAYQRFHAAHTVDRLGRNCARIIEDVRA